MNLRARIRALEQKRARRPAPMTAPPVQFFDAVIAGTATKDEWDRWAPWLLLNLPSLSDRELQQVDTMAEGDPRFAF